MKRFVNKFPLGSVTACISGFQKVRIEDRKYCSLWNDNAKDTVVWEGKLIDFRPYDPNDGVASRNYHRWSMAQVRGISAKDDVITFIISTEYEEY